MFVLRPPQMGRRAFCSSDVRRMLCLVAIFPSECIDELPAWITTAKARTAREWEHKADDPARWRVGNVLTLQK